MRQKMRAGHPVPADVFDLKQGLGGIIDVEFIVQYLVLAYAHQYEVLTQNIGNIGLLATLAELGIIQKSQADALAQAYLDFRKKQHALKLQGHDKARVQLAEVLEQAKAVQALWKAVFD
jgi:glutamate-ammonia-ligase adenylyltransferase